MRRGRLLHTFQRVEAPVRFMSRHLSRFLREEDGPTAVEYAVLLSLIIVICLTSIIALGSNSNNTYSYVGTKVGKTGS
jgi:pilus assembly protein Flp/PilA